jgi:hypothetical protein
VKHRNIDYDVEEIALAQWRWKIYPKAEIVPKRLANRCLDHAKPLLRPASKKSTMTLIAPRT